jgi:hypothetical protein
MTALARPFCPRYLRALETIAVQSHVLLARPPPLTLRSPAEFARQCTRRGAKTTTKRKIKDLHQGAIEADPLPDLEDDSTSFQPQYPPVLQGVRENTLKYPDCVIITRVGNFYEVR